MLKLLIFDMDGLMFDTEAVTYRAYQEVWTKEGYQPTMEQYVQLLGLNTEDICRKYKKFYGENVDALTMFYKVRTRKMEILEQEGIPVKKGLTELLDALDAQGIKKAIASGSAPATIEHNLEQSGYSARFDMTLSSQKVERGKPFPDVFLTLCDSFGVAPEEALVLEDSANGVEAALAGNIPVIQVPDMIALPENLRSRCLAVVDSLEQVIPYIG